jgi:DNA-binding NarL/FixJ family response regulator
VVLVTAAVDPALFSEALAAGCAGFVTKGDSVDELAAAVRAAASGYQRSRSHPSCIGTTPSDSYLGDIRPDE